MRISSGIDYKAPKFRMFIKMEHSVRRIHLKIKFFAPGGANSYLRAHGTPATLWCSLCFLNIHFFFLFHFENALFTFDRRFVIKHDPHRIWLFCRLKFNKVQKVN